MNLILCVLFLLLLWPLGIHVNEASLGIKHTKISTLAKHFLSALLSQLPSSMDPYRSSKVHKYKLISSRMRKAFWWFMWLVQLIKTKKWYETRNDAQYGHSNAAADSHSLSGNLCTKEASWENACSQHILEHWCSAGGTGTQKRTWTQRPWLACCPAAIWTFSFSHANMFMFFSVSSVLLALH